MLQGLILLIYRELSKNEVRDPIEDWAETWNIQFTGKRVKWHLNIFKDAPPHS